MGGIPTIEEPFVCIPPGRYWIGDDSLPNAGPRHPLNFEKAVWIDRRPVSLAELERVVVRGRFKTSTAASSSGIRAQSPQSVDRVFQSVVNTAKRAFAGFEKLKLPAASLPACGLLWQEAADVCSCFGARLPTEAEWEVAMNVGNGGKSGIAPAPISGILSQLGCVGFLGHLQEWTSSEWTDRYWMQHDVHAVCLPTDSAKISVRGCLPIGNVASLHYRLAVSRTEGDVPRVFRRVWEHPPEAN